VAPAPRTIFCQAQKTEDTGQNLEQCPGSRHPSECTDHRRRERTDHRTSIEDFFLLPRTRGWLLLL